MFYLLNSAKVFVDLKESNVIRALFLLDDED